VSTPSWIDQLLNKKGLVIVHIAIPLYNKVEREDKNKTAPPPEYRTRSRHQTAMNSSVCPSVIYPASSAAAFFVSSRKIVKKQNAIVCFPSQKSKPSKLSRGIDRMQRQKGQFPTPPIPTRCYPSSLDIHMKRKDEFFRSFLFPFPSSRCRPHLQILQDASCF
jgi:hypothetical protein